MLLTDILIKNAKEIPDKEALVMRMGYRTVSLSYKDIYTLSLKVSHFLEKSGFKKDDKVLLLAPNSPYWICVFWGVLLRGCIPVPLNIQSTSETVKKISEQTDAKIIFKHLHYKQELPATLKQYDIEFLPELLSNIEVSENIQKINITENDVAELMYTSGTTGDPKGVILTHKNISSNLEVISKLARIAPTDKFLSILPLSHIFEQVIGFLLPFREGVPIFYSHSPTAIQNLLKEHRITTMAAVPEFLQIVMSKIQSQAKEKGKQKIFDKMMTLATTLKTKWVQRMLFRPVLKKFGGRFHTVISGGAPLDPELEKKWGALGIDLLQGYGLTETAPVVATNTYEDHRTVSVGKILPGVEVKISSEGEILVKGPNVFQGYFKDEEKTKESFTSDDWFKTDDIGALDKDGFLYIKGRKKYMILGPGGQNVYPEDIEFELNKIPYVKDSCVVGLEKSGGRIEIHAVLLTDANIRMNTNDTNKKDSNHFKQIINEANKKLALYQQITGWSVWPEEDFPRSATRKVKKGEVLKWLKSKEKKPSPIAIGVEKTPLMRLLADVTGASVLTIRENTKIVPELTLDSLLRIELVSRIGEKFGVEIEEAAITQKTTVRGLEEMIEQAQPVKEKLKFKRWPLSPLISFLRQIGQRLIVFPLLHLFVKIEVRGEENIKDLPLPVVFMSNHPTHYLESGVLVKTLPPHIRKTISFAAAVDVLYEKLWYLAGLTEFFFNSFPFPRKEYENIKFGLEYMGKLLDKDWSIVVYPEGRVSETEVLLPLKRGAGLIAVEMNVFIVPIKVSRVQAILPPEKWFPRRRGVVTLSFGKPIKFKQSDSYIEATEKIQEIMQKL
ncbi:hypothetical protein COB64_03300 [Candidatus Wolfebacteria bacterium]|nr:MAG: hypothetical protein COB64_03300 [Candidatus Wolfebacteria bacterium]